MDPLEQSRRNLQAAAGNLELIRDSAAVALTEERLRHAHAQFILNFGHIEPHFSGTDLETIQASLTYCQTTFKLNELSTALEG